MEYSPWVTKNCLAPNVASIGFKSESVVHTEKVEAFLKRAEGAPAFAGGAFDFVSVTPPYLSVSYPEIYDLLERSPLLHEGSIVMVEYSKQNRDDIRDAIGGLQQVKNRQYGRTFLTIYAAP